jgi:hypothetical protein
VAARQRRCYSSLTRLWHQLFPLGTGQTERCAALWRVIGEAGMLAGLFAGMDACYGTCCAGAGSVQACLQACCAVYMHACQGFVQ